CATEGTVYGSGFDYW
nr:immunoglobulin heavy chain junction region [Macaca mulatta]